VRYAIFDKLTGRIDRIIIAPVGAASATASCAPNEDFVATNGGETDATHYIVNFALTPFPPKPNNCSVWDWSLMTWQTDTAAAWAQVRVKRRRLLAGCDWTQLPDAPLTAAQKTAWSTYRTQLRNITLQANPLSIAWPQEPAP
jgi:hypothetical protein